MIGLLFWLIDARALAATLARADPLLIFAICGMSFVSLFLGALNIWLLLRRLGEIPLGAFTEIYLTSWSLGLLIPGQLGDAAQIVLVRRHGVPAASAAAAYAIDKLASLGMFALIGLYGVARYVGAAAPASAAALALVGVLAAASFAIVVVRIRPKSLLPARVREFSDSFEDKLALIVDRRGLVGLNVAISIVKWLIMATMYYTAFAAVGAAIGFEPAATIPVVSSLVAYIPITVAGLGTTEWTAVGLFAAAGVEPLAVVSVYIIMRGALIACAMLMLAMWWGSRYARAD